MTIATTPPGASSDDAPAGWVNHPVTVTLTPGARALRTTWELDGGATQTGTSVAVAAPADHSGDGAHAVTYRSWAFGDVAEPTRTAVVRVDTRAPQTSDDAPAGWQQRRRDRDALALRRRVRRRRDHVVARRRRRPLRHERAGERRRRRTP